MTIQLDWVEEQPRMRTVFVRGAPRRLMFPWISTIVVWAAPGKFSKMFAFSHPGPLTSIDDALHMFPLGRQGNDNTRAGNLGADGTVCMGNSLNAESDPRVAFWNSNFQECLQTSAVAMWERISLVAPDLVVSMPLPVITHAYEMFRAYSSATLMISPPWEMHERLEMRRAEGRHIVRAVFEANPLKVIR